MVKRGKPRKYTKRHEINQKSFLVLFRVFSWLNKSMKNLRILIAEDHETVRDGLKMIVEAQDDMEVIGEAGDGREAVRLAEELKPDIILMDVSMPF